MVCWCSVLTWVGAIGVAFFALCHFLSERVPTMKAAGKSYFITGGSSGIGLATAKLLAAKGATAVGIAARTQSTLDSAVKEIAAAAAAAGNAQCKVLAYAVDVCSEEALPAAASAFAAAAGGRLDVLIASAGYTNPNHFADLPLSEYKRAMDINFLGVVNATKAVVPLMKSQNSGRIVFISSMCGMVGIYGYSAYTPSKYAVRGFAECMHMELKPFNIAVSLCNPPDVDTPMFAKENETKPEETRLISEGAGLFTAERLAEDIVSGIEKYRFFIQTGFDGHILGLLTAGFAPAGDATTACLEALAMGPLRIVSLVLRVMYDRTVRKVHEKRLKESKKQ